MALRRPSKSDTKHQDDAQPSFKVFYLAVVVGGFAVAAMFGYLAEVASSNGLFLHAAAHSAVAAFGVVTITVIVRK